VKDDAVVLAHIRDATDIPRLESDIARLLRELGPKT
jgi:hypothetical protein